MTALLDGVYEELVDDAPEFASALLAGAAPLKPPKSWFDNPQFDRLTPLTLTADGRIYGHVADWNMSHIGLPGRHAPRNNSGYAFFKTGVLETEEGVDVNVGQLTYVGGHAPLNATAGQAVKHYDDTASAFCDVNVGDDRFGIWVNGGLRPGITEEEIRAIRASAPSGDWRPINGQLEMVACCQVNSPGFPIARAMVASGEITALVAAGAGTLYTLRQEHALVASLATVEDRVQRIEDKLHDGELDGLRNSEERRMRLDERMDALVASGLKSKRTELESRRQALTASARIKAIRDRKLAVSSN